MFSMAKTTNDIMGIPLFSDLLTCALVIAFNLLLLASIDYIDLQIVSSLLNVSTVVLMTFVFCYLSENISESLSGIDNAFYESSWYFLHVQHQKSIIMAIARRGFRLDGLGLIYCSLETFARVIC